MIYFENIYYKQIDTLTCQKLSFIEGYTDIKMEEKDKVLERYSTVLPISSTAYRRKKPTLAFIRLLFLVWHRTFTPISTINIVIRTDYGEVKSIYLSIFDHIKEIQAFIQDSTSKELLKYNDRISLDGRWITSNSPFYKLLTYSPRINAGGSRCYA